jgi:hypothetical protein
MQIPSWTSLGVLLTSVTSRVIYTLPIAGYVILYSDYFERLFKFSSLTGPWGFLSFDTRVSLIYYGSLSLLVAFGLWWVAAPPLLRGKRDLQHFVSDIVVARDRPTVISVAASPPFTIDEAEVLKTLSKADAAQYKQVAEALKSRGAGIGDAAGEYEDRIPTALGFYFKWQNFTKPDLRCAVACFAFLGYGLVLLPSLDLFCRVLGTHYHRLLR